MKSLFILFISTFVFAEQSGNLPIPNLLTLDSPCDVIDAEIPFRLALKTSTLMGQTGFRSQTQIEYSLAKLKENAHLIRKHTQECYSAEIAYQASIVSNRGSASAEASYRYELAKATVRTQGMLLSSPFVDGETEYDRKLSTLIAENYYTQLKELSRSKYLYNVFSLHKKLREAYTEIIHSSIECRTLFRSKGLQYCPDVENKILIFSDQFKTLLANAEIQTNKLALVLKTQDAAEADLISKIMKIQSEIVATNYYLGLVGSWINWWAYCKGWWWGWYWYSLCAGYYYASIGWWWGAWAYWGAANYYLYCHNGCLAIYNATIALYKSVEVSIAQLQNLNREFELKKMEISQAKEKTKGRIMAIPLLIKN